MAAIKALVRIVNGANPSIQSASIPPVVKQGLLSFLDVHSKPGSSLVLNQDLLREILVAIHRVFQCSLELISEAYNQVVANPGCVLGDSQIYEHITAISFAFHPLLEGEFLHWMINSLSTAEFFRIHRGLMGSHSEEGCLRVDVDKAPQVVEVPHGVGEDRSRQCWAWIHSCFDIIHDVEEVVINDKKLTALNALRFFNLFPTDLSAAMGQSLTVIPDWEDIVPRLWKRCVNEEEKVPYDEIGPSKETEVMRFFRSEKVAAVFAWLNQRDFVPHPELHSEAFLATLY